MSYYSKRRKKAGLSKSEVANKLGIDYSKYELIDRGIVKMPRNIIDKFNEIVNQNKAENDIDRLNREQVVNKWWDVVTTKYGYGKFKLQEIMKEFNIDTFAELSSLMGWKNASSVSNYINNRVEVPFDIKNKFYSFFENELNIQPPKGKKENRINPKKLKDGMTDSEYEELMNWYNSMDFITWMRDNNITNADIKNATGISSGSVSNTIRKKYKIVSGYNLKKLKEYIDDINNNESKTITFTSSPIEEVPEFVKQIGQELVKEVNDNMKLKEKLSSKYEEMISEINEEINKYETIISDLHNKKNIYIQVLNDINEE